MSTESLVFSGLVLNSVLYGIHICIFSSTIYFAHRDCKKHDIRTPLWMYACVWVMFVLGTVHIVGNLGFQRKIWLHIVQTDQSLAEWRASNEENFFNILTKTGIAPSFWIQNAVLIQRLSVIYCTYQHRNKLVLASAIGLLASIVIWIIGFQRVYEPVISEFVLSIIHCAFSETLNLAITLAIIGRMIHLRRYVTKYLGSEHAKKYTSLTAIFVESGVMFSVLMLICNARLRRRAGVGFESVVYAIMGQATGICTDLIVFRVALGRAWTSKTLTKTEVHIGEIPLKSVSGSKQIVITKDVHTV